MSISQIANNEALSARWQALKAAEGKIKSNAADIKWLSAEIKTLDGYSKAVTDDDLTQIESWDKLAVAVLPESE